MNCKHCHKPILLSPSAEGRAAQDKSGKTADYYIKLFEYHTNCALELRRQGNEELLARLKRPEKRM